MQRFRRTIILVVLLVSTAGCTGEGVRVVLPERHPANPSATEAPFVPIPDPFAEARPASPSRPAEPHEHRHEHHPGRADDDMRMDDMRMDDDQQDHMKHGGHDGKGSDEREERR